VGGETIKKGSPAVKTQQKKVHVHKLRHQGRWEEQPDKIRIKGRSRVERLDSAAN